MGLWNWIIDQLTEPSRAASPSKTDAGGSEANASDQAVAVLDAPPSAEATEDDNGSAIWWAPEENTVIDPPEIERPDLCTEARAIENLLISHFDGHNLTLPPLLHVAETILPRLGRKDLDLGAVADELSEDQVMAAAVLRMTNSPLYRGLDKIASIKPAIARLGTTALRTLMMHESLRAAMFFRNGKGNKLAQVVWGRSLASACINRGLSAFTGTDKEEAFLIGLLHDIGNVVVLRVVHGESPFAHYDMDSDTFEYLCHESHLEFGELIADSWALPEKVKSLICNHHTYPANDDPWKIDRLQLMAADMISALLSYSPYIPYDLLKTPVIRDLGLTERDDFVSFLATLPDDVDETLGAL